MRRNLIIHPIGSPPVLRFMTLIVLVFALITMSGDLRAQANNHAGNVSDNNALTADSLKSRIDDVNVRKDLDTETKEKVLTSYEAALRLIEEADSLKAQAIIFKKSMQSIPVDLKQIRKRFESIGKKKKTSRIHLLAQTPTAELEQRLIIEQAKLKELQIQADNLGNSIREMRKRPDEIRSEQQVTDEKLEDIRKQPKPLKTVQNSLNVEADAQQSLQDATKKAMSEKITVLEFESLSHGPRLELLEAQRDLVSKEIEVIQVGIKAIENALNKTRESEAENFQKELAKKLEAAAGKHRVLQDAIRVNAKLSNELGKVTESTYLLAQESDKKEEKIKQIENDYKGADTKISLAGLSPALGAILREQHRNLPSIYQLERSLEKVRDETAKVSLKQFQTEERLRLMEDMRAILDQTIALNVDESITASKKLRIKAELALLLEDQNDLLDKLNLSYRRYLRELGEADYLKRELIKASRQYATFLNERLLWVPSSPPISIKSGIDLVRSTFWLSSPTRWMETIDSFYQQLSSYPFITFIVFVFLLFLIFWRRHIDQRLKAITERASKLYSDRFIYTGEALFYTILLAVSFPLLMFFSGWVLAADTSSTEFARAVGNGLIYASIPLIFLQAFHRIFAKEGIARVHFGWRIENVTVFRRQVAWLRLIVVPAIFLIAVTSAQNDTSFRDSLGRLALIVIMASMALVLSVILNPRGKVLERFFSEHPTNWITRFRYVWFLFVTIIPFIVIGFAVAGYYTSALQLQEKLVTTIRISLVALIIHQLVIRWLNLVNRQLAFKKAREKRQSQMSAKTLGEVGSEVVHLETDELDIPTINAQTQQTVRVVIILSLAVGFWWVWYDIFPAFGVLDRFVLWQHSIDVGGLETSQAVTLANFAFSLIYLFVSFIVIRNLPGIFEVIVFRRIAVDPGSRYAVNQLVRYFLVAIVIIVVANELGGDWSQVQWLVAALGVGLGFGLQEIFANFISGIILLFERPVRLGDTVTVGDVTGTVSRIQIRATTITDWDRKELIIPNKTFITDMMINWTLSDPITRVVIPVGIAYGSDPTLAHKIIYDAVCKIPLVLKEPEPSAFFIGFGESSLDFEVRVFVNNLADRLPLTHELHLTIEQALRDHNIEIPFPQRDIHIRSVADLPNIKSPNLAGDSGT